MTLENLPSIIFTSGLSALAVFVLWYCVVWNIKSGIKLPQVSKLDLPSKIRWWAGLYIWVSIVGAFFLGGFFITFASIAGFAIKFLETFLK